MHFDALRGEGGAHLVSRERLFASEQSRPAFDDDHLLAPEPLEALRHLRADSTAAEHEQSARQLLGRRDVAVVPRVDVCEPGNRRDQRSGARRDDHRLRCLERVRRAVAGGDLHHPLAVQAALAPVERDVLVVEPLLLTIVGPVVRHVVALRERGGGIDLARDRLGGTGHPAGRGEHVTRADQRLRRDAAPVRALPTDELLLDEGRCQPSFRAPAGGDLSRWPTADHDHVVGLRVFHEDVGLPLPSGCYV